MDAEKKTLDVALDTREGGTERDRVKEEDEECQMCEIAYYTTH